MAITNEVLATKLEDLTTAINKLESKFDSFTPTNVLELRLKELDVKIISLQQKDKELEQAIAQQKTRSNFQTWVTGSLSACLGSVLTFLIVYFLQHLGRTA